MPMPMPDEYSISVSVLLSNAGSGCLAGPPPPRIGDLIALPVSAPSNDVGPATRQAQSGARSQHRFETARPFNANTAYPQDNELIASTGRAEATSLWRSPGRAVLGVFLRPRAHERHALRKPPRGATLAVDRSGAALPVREEAAGAPSAWSHPLNHPPRDHADGATLGRQRRTRRPELLEAKSGALSVAEAAIPIAIESASICVICGPQWVGCDERYPITPPPRHSSPSYKTAY